jgi:hypothetical protein
MILPHVDRGTFKVIRTDGREETFNIKPTLDGLYDALGCELIDVVSLEAAGSDLLMVRRRQRVGMQIRRAGLRRRIYSGARQQARQREGYRALSRDLHPWHDASDCR